MVMGRVNKTLVSVIIVNWNGRHWLEQCLPTLQTQTFTDFEVVVVDNGSDDGSVAWLQSRWPSVRLLALPENVGFAPANNLGIQATDSPFVVTLNNDTLAEPDWLEAMVTTVTDPAIGMVACQMLMWQQPDRLDSAGIEIDWAGIAWNRGAGQPAHSLAHSADVFGPCAGAALYRRQMLNEVGCFDEDFFAFYEDVDLAWRAQQAGWRCRYQPQACVRHWHSATAGQNIPQKTFLLGRNKLWSIMKNYPWPALIWAWPFILGYDGMAVSYQCVRQRNLAALRGRLAALKAASHMWGKRNASVNICPRYMIPVRWPWRLAIS
jgi:GT2 family glycosyltransferase